MAQTRTSVWISFADGIEHHFCDALDSPIKLLGQK